ncbi:amino acid transporter [Fusarium beomiforme]|uniref:Amino acid transporter n=1 Tax=Fusarium beomiforme TaxID=44412 RepID=A0A9P5DN60_9HYPO|nr:amino acid transporter [Fusarium beomiforme]
MSYPPEQVEEAMKKYDDRDLVQSPSLGPIETANTVTHDAVFGTITQDGPNYRNVGWIGTSVLMMKTQIGLGVLSIPAAFNTLGLIPGVICLLLVAIITTWSNYIVGVFKVNHPEVYGIDDASKLMFGTIGREVLAAGFSLFFMVTISVGVQDRPDAAPPGPWSSDWKLVGEPSFAAAASAISMFVLSYAATPFFFPIVSEMRDPRHYTKALMLCQVIVTITYVTVSIVLYYYCGSYVASPALGSAGKLIKKIAYGFALPGLFASTTLAIHLVGKHFFVRFLRGSRHLTSNTFTHWVTWFGCICGCAIISYCIASGIPVFGPLIGLIGALLGTLQCFQPMGCMWLYDNWSKGKENVSAKWLSMVCWSLFVIISGTFLMIAGTYGSVIGIIDALKADGASGPWSCVDNSNSA